MKQATIDYDLTGIVFNVQRYTVHDGPGTRTELFLKGCPLRCLWCANPEGLPRPPGHPGGGQQGVRHRPDGVYGLHEVRGRMSRQRHDPLG